MYIHNWRQHNATSSTIAVINSSWRRQSSIIRGKEIANHFSINWLENNSIVTRYKKTLHFCNSCKYIQYPMAKHIIMVDIILCIFSICKRSQSTITKHIISINRHNFHQYIFQNVFWILDTLYLPELWMPYTFNQH